MRFLNSTYCIHSRREFATQRVIAGDRDGLKSCCVSTWEIYALKGADEVQCDENAAVVQSTHVLALLDMIWNSVNSTTFDQ